MCIKWKRNKFIFLFQRSFDEKNNRNWYIVNSKTVLITVTLKCLRHSNILIFTILFFFFLISDKTRCYKAKRWSNRFLTKLIIYVNRSWRKEILSINKRLLNFESSVIKKYAVILGVCKCFSSSSSFSNITCSLFSCISWRSSDALGTSYEAATCFNCQRFLMNKPKQDLFFLQTIQGC